MYLKHLTQRPLFLHKRNILQLLQKTILRQLVLGHKPIILLRLLVLRDHRISLLLRLLDHKIIILLRLRQFRDHKIIVHLHPLPPTIIGLLDLLRSRHIFLRNQYLEWPISHPLTLAKWSRRSHLRGHHRYSFSRQPLYPKCPHKRLFNLNRLDQVVQLCQVFHLLQVLTLHWLVQLLHKVFPRFRVLLLPLFFPRVQVFLLLW